MKRRKLGRVRRAPAPYTKYRKNPYKYPDWIVRAERPPLSSIQYKLEKAALDFRRFSRLSVGEGDERL